MLKKICAAYETESDNFQTVLQLMQEMQECGKPPIEIVKELAPGIELGPEGLPNMFGNMDEKKCKLFYYVMYYAYIAIQITVCCYL